MKLRLITLLSVVLFLTVAAITFAQGNEQAPGDETASDFIFVKWIAAGFTIGCSTLAGGIAVGQIGAAAMAAMSENPEMGAKALPYAALAEGICLWGLGGAVMILIM